MFEKFKNLFRNDKNTYLTEGEMDVLREKAFNLNTINSGKEMAQFLEQSNVKYFGERDYFENAIEAYSKNVVVNYCMNLIACMALQPSWELHVDEKRINTKQEAGDKIGLYNFIKRPNEEQAFSSFIKRYVLYKYLAGETFIQRLPKKSAIIRGNGQFVLLEPSMISITKDSYVIKDDNKTITVPFKTKAEGREILHLQDWHPTSNRGLSRLTPAALSIRNHNESLIWNSALLNNSARLSLAAIIKPGNIKNGNKPFTKEQAEELKEELLRLSGSSNRGKALVLKGDWELKEMGLNQQEMEFIKGNEALARNIALAFGIDPVLLGLPGDGTYSNKKEAYSGLFKLTVLPILKELKEELEHWLGEIYPDDDWEYKLNLDDIIALEVDREKLWGRAKDMIGILTIDEIRELLGYGAAPNDLTVDTDDVEDVSENNE